MENREAKHKKYLEWDRATRQWAATHKKNLRAEAWITAFGGVFIVLSILATVVPQGWLQTLLAVLWLVVLLITILSLPLLFWHCEREWPLFQKLTSLDRSLEEHRWTSGNFGKFLAFLHFRRVPHDPIRDKLVATLAHFRRASNDRKPSQDD